MSGQKVILVEDDDTIALGVMSALRHERYSAVHFDNGEQALAAIDVQPPEVVLLDLMLPGIGGLEVLQRVKARHPQVQVILLTARSEEFDRVLGLKMGADDYVTKPFSVPELLARVEARLRNRSEPVAETGPEGPYRFGPVVVDVRRRLLSRGDEEHRLTTHEAGVLGYLIENRGRDVSREELLREVWGYDPKMETRTVDNQVLKLRKKVEEVPANPRHILTVHGTGYRFEP